jgi:hypothetical protein
MRSRILIVGRDLALRGRLAQALARADHRAEVAESLAQIRHAGLKGSSPFISLQFNQYDRVKGRPRIFRLPTSAYGDAPAFRRG